MRGGTPLLLLFAFWAVAGLWAYLKTKDKSKDATQTALYLLFYPAVVTFVVASKPVPAFVASPLVLAGVPWLLAGIHLSKVIKNPAATKPGEFIGLPVKFWLWGLAISVAIPLLLMK
jgi:hypothetical protein